MFLSRLKVALTILSSVDLFLCLLDGCLPLTFSLSFFLVMFTLTLIVWPNRSRSSCSTTLIFLVLLYLCCFHQIPLVVAPRLSYVVAIVHSWLTILAPQLLACVLDLHSYLYASVAIINKSKIENQCAPYLLINLYETFCSDCHWHRYDWLRRGQIILP